MTDVEEVTLDRNDPRLIWQHLSEAEARRSWPCDACGIRRDEHVSQGAARGLGIDSHAYCSTGAGEAWVEVHVGRAFAGHALEDGCPCDQAPCGLIPLGHEDPACPQHSPIAHKTVRQMHAGSECPQAGGDAA